MSASRDVAALARAPVAWPGLQAGKICSNAALLVPGAEAERALGVALVLRDLDQRLELGAPLPVLVGVGAAVVVGVGEHEAPRVVAVVRDGERLARSPVQAWSSQCQKSAWVSRSHTPIASAVTAVPRKITLRWSMPPSTRVGEYSNPMSAVNLPGSLNSSAIFWISCQGPLAASGQSTPFGLTDLEPRRRALREPDEALAEDLHVAVADALAERRRVLRVRLVVDADAMISRPSA